MASVSTIIYAMHPLRKWQMKETFHPTKNQNEELKVIRNYYKAKDRKSKLE